MRTYKPWILGLGLLAACGGVAVTSTPHDGGSPAADAASDDAGDTGDATVIDAGQPDISAPDTGSSDAQAIDAPLDAPADAALAWCPAASAGDAAAPITVSGHILTFLGYPCPGSVTIQGMTATSAPDGSFSLAGVVPPYDAVVSCQQEIDAYIGVTRTDPTLLSTRWGLTPSTSDATVSGSLSPADAGALTGAFLDMSAAASGVAAGSTGGLDVTGVWNAAAPAPATLWGFAATQLPSGGIGKVTAIGSQTMTLTNGVNPQGVVLTMSPAGSAATTLSGTLALPAGYAIHSIDVALGKGDNTGLFVYDTPAADAGSFAYGTFASPLTWAVVASALQQPGQQQLSVVFRTGLSGSETLPLVFPSCSTIPLTPPNGTTTTACATLSWSATPSSVYVVNIIGGPSGVFQYQLVTDRSSLALPFVLPSGQYSFTVRQIADVASIDALTGSFGAAAVINREVDAVEVDHVECESVPSAFVVP
jgi:hypothetical protein